MHTKFDIYVFIDYKKGMHGDMNKE
jgi:hypothetical protein